MLFYLEMGFFLRIMRPLLPLARLIVRTALAGRHKMVVTLARRAELWFGSLIPGLSLFYNTHYLEKLIGKKIMCENEIVKIKYLDPCYFRYRSYARKKISGE